MINQLGLQQEAVPVNCDSSSAINLAKNSVYHSRTKHIDVPYHFIRQVLEEGDVTLDKIHTSVNPADMLTKVVPTGKFKFFVTSLGLVKA